MRKTYRGRLAPSPTGLLHAGHAATFLKASERAASNCGALIYRNDDLDSTRCKLHFHEAAVKDLRWLGLDWHEGPDKGGAFSPYSQSERGCFYLQSLEELRQAGLIYPCRCSRRDVSTALSAPHTIDEEPFYPGTCRPHAAVVFEYNPRLNWRFRISHPENIAFNDGRLGTQCAVAGRDFGDFLVWRKDGVPSYQLSCAVDDALMHITEVVRGEDLVTSTFRQLLLFSALGYDAPAYFHTPLLTDSTGKRLAKRNDSVSIQTLRSQGCSPEKIRSMLGEKLPA